MKHTHHHTILRLGVTAKANGQKHTKKQEIS